MSRSAVVQFLLIIALTALSGRGNSQDFSLSVTILNQPDNPVIFGWISGDDFTPIDSAQTRNGKLVFTFPQDANPGIYRLIFGKTTYAQVMNEDPQQLDLIFNRENISVTTDFKNPVTSLNVVESNENKLWYDFKSRQSAYQKALDMMEQELDLYWQKKDTARATRAADEFNRLQMEWDLLISQLSAQNKDSYAARLIALERRPLADGFLMPAERKEAIKKDYLGQVDFTDEELINSSAYTDKIFHYLVLFNQPDFTAEQRISAYKTAVDNILVKTEVDSKVQSFLKKNLIHGFEVLQMKELSEYIRQYQ